MTNRQVTSDETPPRDRGESLVELLVSISILGVAVTAILGAIAMTATASGLHRDTASVQNHLHNWAEAISNAPDYTVCASAGVLQAAVPAPGLPSGWSAAVSDVDYWDGTGFAEACGTDQGIQRITLSMTSTGSPVAQGTLDVVLRRRCGSGC